MLLFLFPIAGSPPQQHTTSVLLNVSQLLVRVPIILQLCVRRSHRHMLSTTLLYFGPPPCTDLALAITASATLRAHRVSSATHPTPDITLSATCSASCTRRCATDKPSGDNDLRSPGDAESALVIVRRCTNAELGTLDDNVAELPGNCPVWCTDNAISSNAVPAAYYELEWTESWKRVLEVIPLGDDILIHNFSQHS